MSQAPAPVKRRLGWLFPGVLGWYFATLAPGLTWADGARLQLDVMIGGSTYWYFDELRHVPTDGWRFDRLGVAAWDHPLYVMLGQIARAVPVGAPTWRINALSALAAAAAIVVAAQIMWQLSGDAIAAALGALALAVSHTFWFHAVTAEVYTLHALFMLLLILLALIARSRPVSLPLVAFLAGLGLANHIMLILVVLPIIFILLKNHIPASKQWLAATILFVIGWSPWWIQFLRMSNVAGLTTTVDVATGAPWLTRRVSLLPSWALIGNITQYAGWLIYQFTPLGLGLAIYGARRLWQTKRSAAALITGLWAIHALFSANYRVADRFAFHLPSYIMVALLIAVGVAGVRQRHDRLRRPITLGLIAGLIALPVAVYRFAPAILASRGLDEAALGITPIGDGARDTLRYFLDPNKRGDDSADRFARTTLANLPPDALVLTPWPTDQEAYVVLRYIQLVEHQRPDVRLDLALVPDDQPLAERVTRRIDSAVACRPVFLASRNHAYPIAELAARYVMRPESGLLRITPRRAIDGTACVPETPPALSIARLIRSTTP